MNALIKLKRLFGKLRPKGALKFSSKLLKVRYDTCKARCNNSTSYFTSCYPIELGKY